MDDMAGEMADIVGERKYRVMIVATVPFIPLIAFPGTPDTTSRDDAALPALSIFVFFSLLTLICLPIVRCFLPE